jgi:hypothetical protein
MSKSFYQSIKKIGLLGLQFKKKYVYCADNDEFGYSGLTKYNSELSRRHKCFMTEH